MTRVSVIVPTYNRKDAVSETIETVFQQSYRDFELIIADDGSTDGTAMHLFEHLQAQPEAIEILARMGPTSIKPFSHAFCCQGTTVQYHYGVNRGLSTARNRAIRAARGEYLCFLEPDDAWQSEHLATQMSFFEKRPEARVARVSELWIKDGRPRPIKDLGRDAESIFEHTLAACPLSVSAATFHRCCFTQCGVFDENLPSCEEYDFWLRVAARFPVHYVPGTSLSRRTNKAPVSAARTWSRDRFRVYALEKAFQGGNLSAEQRFLVAEQIVHKCERLVEGFRRQKSEERSSFYERKRKRFALEVRKLKASRAAAEAVQTSRA